MLVLLSCSEYERAIELLNNMRRVDLEALLLDECAQQRGPQVCAATPAAQSVYSSHARHLSRLGLRAAAAHYTHLAGAASSAALLPAQPPAPASPALPVDQSDA